MNFTYEEAVNSFKSESKNDGKKIDFFSLKNDGDTAIVRFCLNELNELEIITVHDVPVNDKHRKISCLRRKTDPISTCPLCAAVGADNKSIYPRKVKIYIKLIKYDVDNSGKVVATPMVWERSYKYVEDLKAELFTYEGINPAKTLFGIRRCGVKGDTNTTYKITNLPSNGIYTDEKYPPVPDAFEGYTALGRIVLNRSYEDMNEYLSTGNFPSHKQQTATTDTATAPASSAPVTYAATPVVNQAPATPVFTAAPKSSSDDDLPF